MSPSPLTLPLPFFIFFSPLQIWPMTASKSKGARVGKLVWQTRQGFLGRSDKTAQGMTLPKVHAVLPTRVAAGSSAVMQKLQAACSSGQAQVVQFLRVQFRDALHVLRRLNDHNMWENNSTPTPKLYTPRVKIIFLFKKILAINLQPCQDRFSSGQIFIPYTFFIKNRFFNQ